MMMKRAFLSIALALALAAPAWALTTDKCLECHDFDKEAFQASPHDGLDCTDCHVALKDVEGEHDAPVARYLTLLKPGVEFGSPESKLSCIECHDLTEDYEMGIHWRGVYLSGLKVSAFCSDCHGAHAIKPSDEQDSPTHRENVNATCGKCHLMMAEKFKYSIHGKMLAAGDPKVPVCSSCHEAHATQRAADGVFDVAAVEACTKCHPEQAKTFNDTYHGQVSGLGYYEVAQCDDCHGSHTILPASDPGSLISKENLVKTCAACHPGANENFVQYMPHLDMRSPDKDPAYYYVFLAMVFLLTGTFLFFGIHTVLWAVRAFVEKIKRG